MKNFAKGLASLIALLTVSFSALASLSTDSADAPVFIILGQSNADGSAFCDAGIDSAMNRYYTTTPGMDSLHIWYLSSQVKNVSLPGFAGSPRHAVNTRVADMPPGWMQLWYRNENVARRTAMNMIHGAGTYSREAMQRRGIEGQFGRRFREAYPDKELYVIKLGVSGSGIDTWANPLDDHNWKFFLDSIYRPAFDSLLAMGKRPRLVGVWWMQGCADSSSDSLTYANKLAELHRRLNTQLNFTDVPLYITTIVAPGENPDHPDGSKGYGQGVRRAQEGIAAQGKATLLSTASCPMQYEDAFNGFIHFNHQGINCIADLLMDTIIARGEEIWPSFSGRSPEWKLQWEERFQSDTLDSAVWSKIPRGRSDWNNYMSDADSLYSVRNGVLTLRGTKAWPELADTAAYVTGGVFTKGKKAFGFGRLEISAKLQAADGAWPAIWLLAAPIDGVDVRWPAGGEIDIMERLNHDNFVYQTVHSSYTLDRSNPDHPRHFGTASIDPDGFNVYAVEIYPDRLSFFVNDRHTFTYPRVQSLGSDQYPYLNPFYLLIDMQLGGSWVGSVDPAQLPVEMQIDRVSFFTK